jgi:hypothetical protein
VAQNAVNAYIVNSNWSTDFANSLRDNALDKVSFVAPGTTSPVLSLPWVGLNQLVITLPPVVAEAIRNGGFAAFASAITVSGLKSGSVAFTPTFNAVTGNLVLTFAGGLATDFYTVTVPGAASNSIGVTGRNAAVVQFAVQPGDINGDGRTNDLDYFIAWHNNLIHEGDLRGDLNADGLWNTTDIDIVRSNYQKINPGAPAPFSKKGAALAPWLSVAPLASLVFSTSQSDLSQDILGATTPALTVLPAVDLSVTAQSQSTSPQQ